MKFDRKIYFDMVREAPFGGNLSQGQVDGQNFILAAWEKQLFMSDLRHLAYCLATTKHETASTMLPIEEFGKGKGHEYGKPDTQTGQTYYGRGFVQLTWKSNYVKATNQLDLEGPNDLEWHAHRALDPVIAANIMFWGMHEGWFRGDKQGRHTLARYFDDDTNDSFEAREIINGDKDLVPKWSSNTPIGKLVAGYHTDFLRALTAASVPSKPPVATKTVTITVTAPADAVITVTETTNADDVA
jgi:putative chitinase